MKIEKLGLQLYTIRNAMTSRENTREAFHKMKALGYDVAHCAGYGTDGYDAEYEEFAELAQSEGIEICGTHESFGLMLSNPAESIRIHNVLGCKFMGIGGFHPKSVEEVEQFIENANTVGKNIHPYGFRFTYHNHAHEFGKLENGKTVMDMLYEGLDPVTTSFCLDTYWVQYGGGDVRHWIDKLKGRIDIIHLKDMAFDPEGPYITEVGNGNLWWEGIMEAAEQAGVKYYVVEQDHCPGDPFDSIRQSSEYMHKHFM